MDLNLRTEANELRDFYRRDLLEDTLPFWLKHAPDREWGGFWTALDRNGELLDSDKSVWAQGRFTWMLGELCHQAGPRDEWLELAISGAKFLRQFGFDQSDGRMWFHLTRNGQPLRKRRYSFSESFASIAFGRLASLTNNDEWARLAKQTFDEFVQANLTPAGPAKFSKVRPTRSIGFPMILLNTAQLLRDSIQLETANRWIDFALDLIQRYHLKPDIQCVMEQVGSQGEILDHFDGRTLNPGHAIEAAWFFMAEGILSGRPKFDSHRLPDARLDVGTRLGF